MALLLWGAVGGGAALGADSLHWDAEHTFSMNFPGDFTVTTDPGALAGKSYFPQDAENLRLAGFYSGMDFEGTNLHAAFIVVVASPAKEEERDCARFEGDVLCAPDQEIRDTEINHVPFKWAALADAAAGQRVDVREYWTVRDGRRYEIRLCLTYSDIGMYPPGEKKEFGPEACWKKLTDILNTFSFAAVVQTAAN